MTTKPTTDLQDYSCRTYPKKQTKIKMKPQSHPADSLIKKIDQLSLEQQSFMLYYLIGFLEKSHLDGLKKAYRYAKSYKEFDKKKDSFRNTKSKSI